MKKVFLVMTDPEKGAREDNWTIMDYGQFAAFLETEEGQRRKDGFERLDAASEDDDILYMEFGRAKAAEIKRERNHSDYLHNAEDESGIRTLSLDVPMDIGEEDMATLLDLIADETMDTERMAVDAILKAELPAAFAKLKPQEKDLMIALYFSDKRMTLREYARQCGMPKTCIQEKHNAALRKMRLHYRLKKLI